uniref:Zinc finger, CCHC-type n=1 Tax=Tanacetum cinerariifolium TaxID=118510 RepID=A0A699JHF9_TANCI|nr:zinc finger, CCHC-type [Tanacetum cinerariifolium]
MASNFVKLKKFEGVNFRRWQKKMHFLLFSMSVVYVLTTFIPDDGGENPTVKKVRRRAKWDNDDYVYKGLILNDTVIKHNFFLPPLDQTSNLLTYKFAMTTLTDKVILSGADNRPPMLEKDMHDSWKSRMKLYMMNIQHGRMILESVENGPLIWPSIEENRVTQPKKYSELYATEAIQADCDVKATNIIIQGLPPEVYALVSNHKVAKELWERIQLLMQGTSLTKQARECKLYDEFDKFAYKKGESLREFYLRFLLLLNDMNIYNMKLKQF